MTAASELRNEYLTIGVMVGDEGSKGIAPGYRVMFLVSADGHTAYVKDSYGNDAKLAVPRCRLLKVFSVSGNSVEWKLEGGDLLVRDGEMWRNYGPWAEEN